MIHKAGFASNPAFQLNGRPLIDTRRLFYYGNSQGGIAGGALTAVAPDLNRSVLYVGAMNYSLLLNRSVDFDLYALILNPNYPNPLERQLVLSMIQVLWDRGEPNGYAWHMTDDPPPEHAAAQGAPDPLVRRPPGGEPGHGGAGADASARTCACRRWTPGATRTASPTTASRASAASRTRATPRSSSGTSGRCGPPAAAPRARPSASARSRRRSSNVPPRVGVDPHDLVIQSEPRIRRQISEFLRIDGKVIDVCGSAPCHAAGWTGP